MGLRLDQLPPHLRERVEAKMRAEDRLRFGSGGIAPRIAQKPGGGTETRGTPSGRATGAPSRRREPNKTEAEYNRLYLSGAGRYEAITLKLPGGSRYTPDWVSAEDGRITLHECKGAYRFGSHNRAQTAFREAAAAFPEFGFVWAVRKGQGNWEVSKHG